MPPSLGEEHTPHASLNAEQLHAVRRILTAEDFALVLGMPGTGKTSLVAHAVRLLVSLGRRVLLTAHTHSAVDNLMLKLLDHHVPLLRIGASSKVHPRLHPHTLDAIIAATLQDAPRTAAATSADGTRGSGGGHSAALDQELCRRRVVGTTALAACQPVAPFALAPSHTRAPFPTLAPTGPSTQVRPRSLRTTRCSAASRST